MKKFLLILLLLIICPQAHALEIVYPKKNPVVIAAPSTFFIGSVKPNEKLKINDVDIKVSEIGAFAQKVDLNFGTNNFLIKSDNSTLNFIIVRPQTTNQGTVQNELIEYPIMSNFYVKNDNTPLRMTPVDAGINRLSHLQKGVQLMVNGEKGDFYRIYLNSKLNGWIAKTDVEQIKIESNLKLNIKLQNKVGLPTHQQKADIALNSTPLRGIKQSTRENKHFCYYEYELSQKIPFIIREENGLTLQIFNVENQPDDTFSVNISIKKLFGYETYYEGNKLVLKVRKMPEFFVGGQVCPPYFQNITIAIDAGHGGAEFGAIGCCGDKEKDINLAISKLLQEELKHRGAKIIMTRTGDCDVALSDRVKIAKDNNAAILISVHANALPDGQDPAVTRGTSVYYYHNQAKALAENILAEMTKQLGTKNDKVRQGSLALVRPTASVSVLIEVAYIINPDDYALLLDKNFQQNCAKAIADGVEKYLLQN